MRSRFFVALVTLLCTNIMGAQQPAAKSAAQAAYVPSMTFDVASIREGKPATDGSITLSDIDPPHSSMLRLSNFSVPALLYTAYGANYSQIVGMPDWARSPFTFFIVEAKSDASADEKLAKLTDEQARLEKQHMMQALLAGRFQLKVHWETKEGPIYDLVVAKGGSKLQPGGSMPPTAGELQSWGDRKIPPIRQQGSSWAGFDLIAHQCSMESLAKMLTGQMGATPVVDKTGLTGTYDFDLRYKGGSEDDASDDPKMPRPLTEALPDQLGLKLVSARGEKQFLVIDHMERPSAN